MTNWAVGTGIYVDSNHNTVVDHCRLNNQIGDALETDNSVNAVFFACDVENCAGRGISLGGSGNDIGSKVIACRFYNCETNANAYLSSGGSGQDGHGSINFSLGGKDSLILGNQIDTGITGIGALGKAENSGASIRDNVIRNMTTYAIDGQGSEGSTPATDITIEGNRIYNSVRVYLNQGAANTGAVEWALRNNLFVETDLYVNNYQQVDISGNRFYTSGTSLSLLTLGNSGGTIGVQNSTISGNRMYGGNYGIISTTYDSGLVISSNVFVNQLHASIQTVTAGPNVLIANNVIIGGANSTNGTTNGIEINGQVEARQNVIDFSAQACNTGIRVDSSASKARINGNTISVPSGNNSMQVISGASYVELRDNLCNTTYSDSGTNTVKAGNRINNGQPVSGQAALSGGTATVTTAEVLTGDNIILSRVVAGGTLGNLSVGTISNKASFVVNSSSGSDTSTVYWEIRH